MYGQEKDVNSGEMAWIIKQRATTFENLYNDLSKKIPFIREEIEKMTLGSSKMNTKLGSSSMMNSCM